MQSTQIKPCLSRCNATWVLLMSYGNTVEGVNNTSSTDSLCVLRFVTSETPFESLGSAFPENRRDWLDGLSLKLVHRVG